MNVTYNFVHDKIGAAGSLGEAGQSPRGHPPEKCKTGKHKWQMRRTTRKCVGCGVVQWQGKSGIWRFET